MFDVIRTKSRLPALYQKSETAFWDDEHISKQMLQAHLDPQTDGASRRLDFIEQSASWIQTIAPPQRHPVLLDVGCGPGTYAERFAQLGYTVTGVDLSRRSIGYARDSAAKKGLDIRYVCQDYLALDIGGCFDLAAMIYCDYGALSAEDRRVVLRNIYQRLKPGGKLLLDVFTMAGYSSFKERQTWESYPNGGFWRGDEHIVLERFCKYPANVTLDQYLVLSNSGTAVYHLWNTYFTIEALTEEAKAAGFSVCGAYGDVAGAPLDKDSPTLAALLMK